MDKMILYGPISQIVPLRNLALKGKLQDEELEIIEDGGILISGNKIVCIDKFEKLRNNKNYDIHEIVIFNNKFVALPGLIDCHTHICYAGSRASDYALRNSGTSYLDIAKQGGGIMSTVKDTREADVSDLVDNIVIRANQMLHRGVTTIEVKSGYALSKEGELKMLRAIQKANTMSFVDLISTFLGAHIIPPEFEGHERKYLDYILNDILPVIIDEDLSSRVDIFIEESAFSVSESKRYLMAAKKLGFDLTVHADQFSTGGSKVAVECNALSADHLEVSTDEEIHLLAKSHTVGVALPGASMGLGCKFTPARKILDCGGSLAIASDWNPGSAPMGHLLLQASVLGAYEKLSCAEVLSAITFRAAAAINEKGIGTLDDNKDADIILFPGEDYREILYHQGMLLPEIILKKGKIVKGEL